MPPSPTQQIAYQSPLDTLIKLLGNQNTETDTTTNQATNQLLNSLLTQLTTSSGGTQQSGTTTNTADLGALQQVFQNNIGGMSPDMLKSLITSIFTEGSAQVPSIIGAYANATGSRATGNSASRLALDELNKNLSTTAAQALLNYNTQAQQTAGNAASNIAANTRQTQQTQQQTQQNTQQQQQQQQQTNTGTTATTQNTNQAQTIKPNYNNIGLALGGSLLNNLLKNGSLSKFLGLGGSDAIGGLTMGAGGSPLAFSGGPTPGGITSFAAPSSFASPYATTTGTSLAGPTGLNNNFTGLGAAPTQQQLVQSFLPQAQANFAGAPSTGLAGVGGPSTLGLGGGGVSGLGSPTTLGSFDGSGIMGAGSLLNFGGIGAQNADFLGSAMGGLGALGGGASTLADAGGAFGTNLAGNGGITDVMSSFGGGSNLGFSDFLSQGGGSGVGSLFGGIGDALSGAADWIGSFFADGGMVGRRRMGYADGGTVGASGYRPTGGDIFSEAIQRRAMEAGLAPGAVQLQAGNVPRIAGTADLPSPSAGQVAGLIPFLIQQMLMPGRMMTMPQMAPGAGFADGGTVGSPGIFGMADGGVVRNRNNMGLAPVRQQTGAMNFAGYDNPQLAEFVNRGGNAAEYIDPAARAAELALRQQMEQQAQAEAMRIAGGQAFQSGQTAAQVAGTGAYEGGDPRMAGINEALAAIQRGTGGNLALQVQQLTDLANTTQDAEVANYYRYLANNVSGRLQEQMAAENAMVNRGGSGGVGEGGAPTSDSVSEGQAGNAPSGGMPGAVTAGMNAIGVPGIATAVVNAVIGQLDAAVNQANQPGLTAAEGGIGSGIGGGIGGIGDSVGASGIGDAGSGVGGVGSGAAGIGGIGDAATSGVGVGVGADAGPSSVGDSGGGGGGGGSKIICTAMNDLYGLPYRENKVWIGYAAKHLTKQHERGYHKLFLPLVQYGFKSGDGYWNLKLRSVLIWIAKNRTQVLRDRKAGIVTNRWHHILCTVGEKICYFFGK